MSDLARLTVDLARRLGATRVLALGARAPQRLAEIAERIPVLALDTEPRLAELARLAPDAQALAWDPETDPPGAAVEAAADSLIVCDDMLGAHNGPLDALTRLLETAPAALISTADRDLMPEGSGAPLNAHELVSLLDRAGLSSAWLGLTDAHGSLGRRAGLTAAISKRRAEAVREALAAGPRGLGFDPATEPPAGRQSARVCIASYEFVGPTRTGGIGTAYTSLAEALAGAGHRVTRPVHRLAGADRRALRPLGQALPRPWNRARATAAADPGAARDRPSPRHARI